MRGRFTDCRRRTLSSSEKQPESGRSRFGFPERAALREITACSCLARMPRIAGLPPNKIQEREDILAPFERKISLKMSVMRMGEKQYSEWRMASSSNAPFFNFNDDKVKFDTNDVDNAERELWLRVGLPFRSRSLNETNAPDHGRGIVFIATLSTVSIRRACRPISSIGSWSARYFLLVDRLRLAHQAG